MLTSLDELKYEGGYPKAETIQKLYNQLDLQRAARAYLDFMSAMSMQAVLDAHPLGFGVSETGGLGVYVEPGEGKWARERDCLADRWPRHKNTFLAMHRIVSCGERKIPSPFRPLGPACLPPGAASRAVSRWRT